VAKKKSNGGDSLAEALVICQQAPWDCWLACCLLPVQHPGKGTLLVRQQLHCQASLHSETILNMHERKKKKKKNNTMRKERTRRRRRTQ